MWMQLQGYDLIQIAEMWWDCSHNCRVVMDGYRLFGKEGEGSRDAWSSAVGWVLSELRAYGSGLGSKPM